MRKEKMLTTLMISVLIFSVLNITIFFLYPKSERLRRLNQRFFFSLSDQDDAKAVNRLLGKGYTSDCNYLDCSRISYGQFFSIGAETSNNSRRLVEFRNRQEVEIYKTMKSVCEKQRMKWENYKENSHKPSNNDGIVRIFWLKPKIWFRGTADYGLDRCSTPCGIVTEMNASDVVVVNMHMFKVQNDSYKIIRSKMKNSQKLAHMSLENAFLNHYNKLNKYEIMLRDVDYLVHIFPFSDVPIHYERQKYDNAFQFDPLELDTVIQNKSNETLIASFISNCPPEPKDPRVGYYRFQYILEMGKHIDIDHYGRCNHFQSRKEEPRLANSRRENKFLISKKYKFTIVFENAIFYNYLSEKLTDIIGYTIPIYIGPPNIHDIMDEEIRNSKIFIDANKFPDPKDLITYLLYLDQNERAYREYFRWLMDGNTWKTSEYVYNMDMVENEKGEVVSALCRLCEFYVEGRKKCHMDQYKKSQFIVGFN